MALRTKQVAVFDKGLVSAIGRGVLPPGAASEVLNFLDLGDRIELIRGQKIFGDESAVAGVVHDMITVEAVDGTEVTFRRITTKIQWYNPANETWTDALTGLTNEEGLFAAYRTPAGSFVWFSSPNTGLYRCNVANPTSWHDFYNSAKNHKGYITIQDNRMWLWKKLGSETVLFLSYIDDDWPYTAITNEALATGDGATRTFTGSLAQDFIVGRSINNITDGVETFTDNGMGVLTGSAGGTGTINYTTGAYSVTFAVAPLNLAAITIDYTYEKPTTSSVGDFTYSAPRTAGQGNFFFQAQGSKDIQLVLPYDEKFYCFHRDNTWVVDLTADDTAATNKIYRDNTGIPSAKAAVPTGEGIYYVDDTENTGKSIRLLQYDEVGTRVIPKSVSEALDLDDYVFDESVGVEYGDLIIFACKSSSAVSYNDLLLIYNRKFKLWDIADGLYNSFTIRDGKLYGGSSVNDNVYQLLVDFDDDDSAILGSWTSGDDDLNAEELKKVKGLLVWGDIADSQELIVEVSYDDDEFVELGRIAGDSEYVDTSAGTEYGVDFYGSSYGSNDTVTAYPYMRRFHLRQEKFLDVRVRFRTEEVGYLNVRGYRWDDVRLKRLRTPEKYRG